MYKDKLVKALKTKYQDKLALAQGWKAINDYIDDLKLRLGELNELGVGAVTFGTDDQDVVWVEVGNVILEFQIDLKDKKVHVSANGSGLDVFHATRGTLISARKQSAIVDESLIDECFELAFGEF